MRMLAGLDSAVTASKPRSLHDLGFSELVEMLAKDGVILHHAKVLWRVLHREGELDLAGRNFLPPLKRWISDSVGEGKPYFLDAPEVVDEIRSLDGLTRKFLLRLRDGQTIETVVIEDACARAPAQHKVQNMLPHSA